MKKTLLSFALFCATFCIFAKSFSLQVIQKNTPGDEIFDASYVVEQTIMDYFFERGMIVSNSAVLVSNKSDKDETMQLRRSFIEAKTGSMELFIKIWINFTLNDSFNPTAILLSNIKNAKVEVVDIQSDSTLFSENYVPQSLTSSNDNRGGVEMFASNIAKDIQLRFFKKGGKI